MTSVFESNKDREVNIYIMIDKPLLPKNQTLFSRLAERYHQHIFYTVVDNGFLSNFPLKGDGISYWSIVTYYRLYAADLLPDSVDKVLYLDCDIIVDGSLGVLFDMDWNGVAIGAVADMCIEWEEFYARLQYDRQLGYFNAGVVFMNLDYWRKHNVGKECLDFLGEHYNRIINNDQDVLNYVLRDRKLMLPVTYNYQIQLRMPYFFNTFTEELKQDVLNTTHPLIIHYAAELKPWMTKYYSYPFYNVWHKYKKISLWKNMPDELPATRKFVAWIKRYFLWPIGLKLKKPEIVIL